ncbi:MAG TPA: N-6 DNA methylase, partial [Planctomycetota bacterium]|nr:N-6 DNA methylase [Planctomycetota bacterium]
MAIMDIDALIDQKKASISREFRAAAESSRNEAEFRTGATRIIERFAEDCELNLVLREEYTLVNGRADAVYDRLVIEYEPPRSLRESRNARTNTHAIAQVKRYLKGLERLGRHKPERLAGVAFDGHFYLFVREREGVWHVDDPLPVTPASTERFLRTLASLSTELALIPENLVRDFGEKTRVAREVVSTFYAALASSDNKRSTVLFDQWSRQFSEVCDYEQASKVNVSDHARNYGVTASKVDPFRLFFCIHTYYAVLIKLLAVQITHFYLMPKMGTDLKSAATLDSERLRHYLKRMEDGGIFHELGINNFLEGDFFSWYLDAWSPKMENSLRTIISTLANYSLVTLDVDPEATRDLLKHLYQDLMPKALRHNLGEYYTPDWLAQRTLNMLEGGKFKGDPKKRLLDPSCGSGTFLVLAIRAIREYGWRNSIRERDLLESILENVVGFDLNPLAVISARTNYLLALGDLLQHRAGEITIPVYLCDSILTPTEKKDLWGHGACEFSTAVGAFSLPASLVEARYID